VRSERSLDRCPGASFDRTVLQFVGLALQLVLATDSGSPGRAVSGCPAALSELDHSWLTLKEAYRRGHEEVCGLETRDDYKKACLMAAQPTPTQLDTMQAEMHGKSLAQLRAGMRLIFDADAEPATIVHHAERLAVLEAAEKAARACGGRIPARRAPFGKKRPR
jgi:hypothetical protein